MSSSLGLKLSVPADMASRLRESAEQETPATEIAPENVASKKKPQVPQISINLERLVGYRPDPEELQSIQFQLLSAMWTRYRAEERQEMESTPSESHHEEPPPDFDFQVVDLLESGVATFSQSADQLITDGDRKNLVLSYPPTIIVSNGETKSTTKMWCDSSTCPSSFEGKENTEFIPRLWKHLSYCSRNLDWKYQMSLELGNLVEEEQARLDYNEWTSNQRKAKLDQLYSIRETIVHQVDVSRAKYDIFMDACETLVKEDMQLHRRQAAVGSADLSFPDEFALLGLNDRSTENEEDWGLDDDSYMSSDGSASINSIDDEYSIDGSKNKHQTRSVPTTIANCDKVDGGYECDHDDDAPASTEKRADAHSELPVDANQQRDSKLLPTDEKASDEPSTNTAALLPFQNREERRRRAKQRKRIEKKQAERRAEKERLEILENKSRQKHTSNDMIIAQTMLEALSKKLENVEELLESLQDEEWQAEEELENEASSAKLVAQSPEESFTLLDQILAMILGTTPIQQNMSPKEHYQFVQEEHRSIVSDWKNHFGRLPPSVGNGNSGAPSDFSDVQETQEMPSPAQLRLQLGITDNIDGDWDADDDWEDTADNQAAKRKVETAKQSSKPSALELIKPRIVGLRPGGRMER